MIALDMHATLYSAELDEMNLVMRRISTFRKK